MKSSGFETGMITLNDAMNDSKMRRWGKHLRCVAVESFLLLAVVLPGGAAPVSNESKVTPIDGPAGDFTQQSTTLKAQAERQRTAGNAAGEIDATVRLAAVYQSLGQYELAIKALEPMLPIARKLNDPRRLAVVKNGFGAALTFAQILREDPDDMPMAEHEGHMHGDATVSASLPATVPTSQPSASGTRSGALPLPPSVQTRHGGGMSHGGGGHRAMAYGLVGNHFAESELTEALQLTPDSDPGFQAVIHNNLGAMHAVAKEYPAAIAEFDKSRALAKQAGDMLLAAKAGLNLATASLRSYDPALEQSTGSVFDPTPDEIEAGAKQNAMSLDRARIAITTAADDARGLPASHDKAFLLLGLGSLAQELMPLQPASKAALVKLAYDDFTAAQALAHDAGDDSAAMFACGYLGSLYEAIGQADDALVLTRRAAFAAQQRRQSESLYRWQWQTARLLRTKIDPAATADAQLASRQLTIEAYQHAVTTLQPIRNDVAIGYSNRGVTFRTAVSPLYFELADLQLKQAAVLEAMDHAAGNDAHASEFKKLLFDARETVELLKTAELEDYFQDPCVKLHQDKPTEVDKVIDSHTAIVYLIPLTDRTEIVVTTSGGRIARFAAGDGKTPLPSRVLNVKVARFREEVENQSTARYKSIGSTLYQWIIRPIKPMLDAQGIRTLVFVPDGPLRTVPMGALYDLAHEKFLIEDYAVAVTPGLTLMEPRKLSRVNARLLISGLSVSRFGFAPLANVPEELSRLQEMYQGRKLLNGNFLVENVEQELGDAGQPYSIVHIASHGMFNGDINKTFILTYGGRLNLSGLESLIAPSNFSNHPVELLALSACETAAGDDRAALGLAGVAIKAGARSALASLWSVNDSAATELISDFYRNLREHPEMSKAQALQAAQIKLLKTDAYHHPALWSPFLIIGNWL